MSDPFLGQIEAFAFGFAPRGWAPCNGQLMPIAQYQALFSLLGTQFGGNGVATFGLPDLRGHVANGMGASSWGTAYTIGGKSGTETVTLVATQMPAVPHTHSLNAMKNDTTSGAAVPSGPVLLGSGYEGTTAVSIYATAATTTPPQVVIGTLSPVGGTQHSNLMPYNVLNYCISLTGIYPSRN